MYDDPFGITVMHQQHTKKHTHHEEHHITGGDVAGMIVGGAIGITMLGMMGGMLNPK